MLAHPSREVAQMTSTASDVVVIVSYDTLVRFFLEKFYRLLTPPTPSSEDALAIKYFAELEADLFSNHHSDRAEIARRPYVQDWLIDGRPQIAGDTAVASYTLRRDQKRHNPLSGEDYLIMAKRSYLHWFEQSHARNIGYIVSQRVQTMLPKIGDTR